MSKKESIRKVAEKLGVSPSKEWRKRQIEGEDLDIVYAWRWSGDDMYAKIGVSKMTLLKDRMAATYHPTDDPVLIGVMKCPDRETAEAIENAILNSILQRTRPDREWIIIDEWFNRMIDEVFISDPNDLHQIFGEHIKTRYAHDG